MSDKQSGEAVFGVFDGMVSVVGLVVGLLSASPTSIVRAAVGLAVASAFGMGAGEYLADEGRNLGLALVMAGATLVGTLGPTVPFVVLPKSAAIPVGGAIAVLVAGAIAAVRSRFESSVRAWVETFVILIVAAVVTVGASILTGAVG